MESKWVEMANISNINDAEPIGNETFSKWEEKFNKLYPKPEEDWQPVIKKALANMPTSLMEFGKNIYTAIRHPVETAKTIGSLGKGAGQAFMSNMETPEAQMYDRLETALKERYGTKEGFKKYVAEDPIGVLSDIASIVIPAGKLMEAGGLTKTGETISKAGSMLEPVNLATKPIREVALLATRKLPTKLYEGAVKLSTTLPINKRKLIVNTALENQIMPTYNGLNKLSKKIDTLNSEITRLIDAAVINGQKIPIDRLFKGFANAQMDLLKVSGEPIKGAKLFGEVENEIREANKFLGRNELTPAEAQKMKQRIYAELDKEYSRVSLHPIKAEARMLVARNIKKAIEEIIPEIKQLNKSEGELIELRKAITQATERISNRDLLSLGTTAKAAGGGAVAGAPGIAAGLTLGMLDSQPLIKAKLSLVIAKMQSKGINIKPTPTLIRLGLFQTGRTQDD